VIIGMLNGQEAACGCTGDSKNPSTDKTRES
jgi:hypothetical protein